MTYFDKDLSLELGNAYRHLKQVGCLRSKQNDTWAKMLKGTGRILTDSRLVKTGDIFVAYQGLETDSHKFIPGVLSKKPGLIIAENCTGLDNSSEDVPILFCENSRQAWAYLCALACGNPQDKLQSLAITGTNGKTSSLWILKSLFESHQIPYLTIGTLGIYINGQHYPSQHTTPDPPMLYLSLKKAVDLGVTVMAMEASSHSIVQEKLAPIRFSCAAWTSFSQDHLDFHETMEAYWKVKWSLFTHYLQTRGRAILNTSLDPSPPVEALAENEVITYGQGSKDSKVDLRLSQAVNGKHGSQIELSYKGSQYRYQIPFWGVYNLENFLCALAMFETIDGKFPEASKTIELSGIPGRLQKVQTKSENKPCVLIDYAHTPDALEKAIDAIKPDCKGKVIVVFGCGGDRDHDKRSKMGAIAEAHAHKVILTSDNPRSESPKKIIDEIKTGFLKSQPVMIEDRKSAIFWSISNAHKDDFVLIAGKGHESYQIIGSKVFEFDDYKIAKSALEAEK